MTADECRRQKRHEAIEGEELLHMTAAIWEIAAQLAELNEALKSYDKDGGTRIFDVNVRKQ
jgi:hypothetical protein